MVSEPSWAELPPLAVPMSMTAGQGGVVNRTIFNMINFCQPGTPITARRALQNVLQSRRVYQSSGHRFFYSPRCDRAHPDTSDAPGSLLAPEPAVRIGAGFQAVTERRQDRRWAQTVMSVCPSAALR